MTRHNCESTLFYGPRFSIGLFFLIKLTSYPFTLGQLVSAPYSVFEGFLVKSIKMRDGGGDVSFLLMARDCHWKGLNIVCFWEPIWPSEKMWIRARPWSWESGRSLVILLIMKPDLFSTIVRNNVFNERRWSERVKSPCDSQRRQEWRASSYKRDSLLCS